MNAFIKTLIQDDSGQDVAEYSLVVMGVAVTLAVVFAEFGDELGTFVEQVADDWGANVS